MGIFRKKKKVKITQSRKVTRARFLYLYLIFGSVSGLLYLLASIFLGLPKHFALTPAYLIVVFVLSRILIKNRKLIWLYVRDMEQGKLLLYLNENTHWEEEHKLQLIRWVYLRKGCTRRETLAEIGKEMLAKEDIPAKRLALMYSESVFCPQQLRLSFNEALLTHCLIHAHKYIQVLDDELRDIMKLSDEHIVAFDIMKEYSKAGGKDYDKYMAVGKAASERLKQEGK